MRSFLKQSAVGALLAASVALASAATRHVHLTGRSEVPEVRTHAWASGVIEISRDGHVSGEIHVHNVKATMAHIHEGAPDANGPPIIVLKHLRGGTWVVPKGAKLTHAEYKRFLAGDLYVNVHSKAHPAGEIRGQLKP
jgi:hypothetical protein